MKKENSTYVTYGDLSFLMMLIAAVIMVVICTAAIRIDLLQDQINTLQSDIAERRAERPVSAHVN